MPELWLLACLLAVLANVIKVLLVKTHCCQFDTGLLLLAARLLPAILLLPVLFFVDYTIYQPWQFWGATLATVLLTLFASQLYLEAVKLGDISLVTPVQATVPMFMMLCTGLWYQQLPPPSALLFIVLIVLAVCYVMYHTVLNRQTSAAAASRSALLYSLLAAALFGISTVLDRVAISAVSQGALVYTAWWHLLTVLCLLPSLWRKWPTTTPLLQHKAVWVYVLAGLLAFIGQQYAVQHSLHLDNGVTYVKTMVMTHIVIAAFIGIYYLKEPVSRSVLLANVITFLSGLGLLWSI